MGTKEMRSIAQQLSHLKKGKEKTVLTTEQRKQRNTESKQKARKASGEKAKIEARKKDAERRQKAREASGEEAKIEARRKKMQSKCRKPENAQGVLSCKVLLNKIHHLNLFVQCAWNLK